MRSDTLTMSESENGRLKYKMETPLMERYELAREPYSEYRQGLYMENYKDSSMVIQSTIRANYAIYYEKRDEWMATGNVIATGEDGRTLYTEQLFYNVKTGRVYSNVESTVVQGNDMFIGEGFESDDKFEEWVFRNYIGRVAVDLEEERNSGNPGQNGERRTRQDSTRQSDDPDQAKALEIKPASLPDRKHIREQDGTSLPIDELTILDKEELQVGERRPEPIVP